MNRPNLSTTLIRDLVTAAVPERSRSEAATATMADVSLAAESATTEVASVGTTLPESPEGLAVGLHATPMRTRTTNNGAREHL